MALTNAERQKRFRNRLKTNGKYEDYKEQHRQKSRKSRDKKQAKVLALPFSLRKKKIQAQKAANRLRVAKCRDKKKQKQIEVDASKPKSPFRSAMAFAKATARAKRILHSALPSSPRKRQRVSQQLFKEVAGNNISQDTVEKRTAPNAISPDNISLVKQFYERDDVSRQAPGIRDNKVFLNEDGKKTKIQIRHLTASLKETYALFCEEYPHLQIGKTKFSELRPKHVYLTAKLPHNVCACRYHENFINAVDALHKVCPNIPIYSHNFPASLLCKSPDQNCWMNLCDHCKDSKGFKNRYTVEGVADDGITWHVWKKCEDSRLMKVVVEGTLEDLLAHFCDLIPQFLEHCYIKREQASAYNAQKEKVQSTDYDPEVAMMQVDFSENYACTWQDEIQTAHWNQRQITLFTVASWHTGGIHSSCLVSDNLTHSKETIIAYIDRALEDLPTEVKTLYLWTDGPSSQFKNRFVAAAILNLEKKHGIKIKWSYFATSHGKGPVDGIGGAAKRFVWDGVRGRRFLVSNAATFVHAASALPKIHVEEVTSLDIERRNQNLKLEQVFDAAATIKEIARKHYIEIVDGKAFTCLTTADADIGEKDTVSDNVSDEVSPTNKDSSDETVKVGQWCVVEYDGEKYPGEIKEISNQQDFRVSVMHPAGTNWKWPSPKDDKTFYLKEQIIKYLEEPVIANNRGHFKFTSHF